ncbi:MAG: hypothetical protein V3U18_06970 [Alphaproteobacteria bacterium]
MKGAIACAGLFGLLVATTLSLSAAAEPETTALGSDADCKSAPHYPRLFASIAEGESRKASPPPIVLPALPESELSVLKEEFLVENGYVGPGSETGADRFEMCAPYGLLNYFRWSGDQPARSPDDQSAAVEIAERFLVDNSGLTGVTRKNDLSVKDVRALEGLRVEFAPQTHEGLPVTNTGIIVWLNGHKVERIYLHWYPDHVLRLPKVRLTEGEAKSAIVGVTLKFRGTAGDWHYAEITEEGLGAAELIITPIERPGEGLSLVLEWKIGVSAGGLKSWMVYVDAVTGAITRTDQLFET